MSLRSLLHRSCFALVLVLAGAPSAWAWGCAGHQIVAYIALRHLDPGTRAAVDAILAADTRAESRGFTCPGVGLAPLVAAANWADAVRNGATAPEHYVDLPLSLTADSPHARELYEQACADRCVSWAIDHYAEQLANAGNAQIRGTALRYLEHFVGDVHQPLHDEDDGDRGGNSVKVYLPGGHRQTNLHAAWDTGILASLEGGLDNESFAARLDAKLGRAADAELATDSDDPEVWAWESHALAAHAYRSLPADGRELSPAYILQAQPIMEWQLECAGIRLARLLERLLA